VIGEDHMGKFMKLNWAVLIFCLLGIVLSLWLIPDWAEKILAVFTIVLFFVAEQQNFAAQNSAHAAECQHRPQLTVNNKQPIFTLRRYGIRSSSVGWSVKTSSVQNSLLFPT